MQLQHFPIEPALAEATAQVLLATHREDIVRPDPAGALASRITVVAEEPTIWRYLERYQRAYQADTGAPLITRLVDEAIYDVLAPADTWWTVITLRDPNYRGPVMHALEGATYATHAEDHRIGTDTWLGGSFQWRDYRAAVRAAEIMNGKKDGTLMPDRVI
jgi:hypothetical protein